ncbi:unnamed protein product [Polarella glacialis]|uniref:Uncharacterized protein n=1 Tax=Polarella glacialis TaxID=89957 RepID=A0A813IP00_POLGL|nr:unnamed protein product [Polarella glacialis]
MVNETWGEVDMRRFAIAPLLASVSLALIGNVYYLYSIFRTWWEEAECHSKPPVATSEAHEPDETAGDHSYVLHEECVAAWNAACFGNFLLVAKYIAALHATILLTAFGLWCGAESETRASLAENAMLMTVVTAIWLPVANGRVTVSRGIVLLCTSASHLLNVCDLIQTPPGGMTILPHGQLRTALGLLLCDSRVNVPTQFVVSLVHIWNAWDKRRQINALTETDWNDLVCSCLGEFSVFSSAIIFGTVWEHALWIQTEALVQAKVCLEESKSSWQAARGLLAGMCDADLEIDSDLNILSSSDKLSHLLMCDLAPGSKAMEGRPFTSYLDEPDQARFAEFIETASRPILGSMSSDCAEGSPPEPSIKCTPAASLHVHIRGAAGLKFAAEVFHVAVPISGHNAKFRHLLGIKEEQFQRCGTSIASADRASEILNEITFSEDSDAAANLSRESFDLLPLGANFKSLMPGDNWSASKSSASGSSLHASAEGSRSPLERIKFVVDSLSPDMSFKEVTFFFNSNAPEELPKLSALLWDESVVPFQAWLEDHVNAHSNNMEPVQPELEQPVAMRVPGSGRNRLALVAAEATFSVPNWVQDIDADLQEEEEEEEEEEEDEQSEESEEEKLWVQLELRNLSFLPREPPRPPQSRASRLHNPVLPTVQESQGPQTTKRVVNRQLSAQVD